MKTTVQRAYHQDQRVLADSEGRIYVGDEWTVPSGRVIRIGERYERWVDVPQAWLGHAPYWRG